MPTVKEAIHDRIVSSFASNGFQLTDVRPRNSLSLEDTVVCALRFPTARLLEGIPVLLAKNKVDYSVLKNQIDKYELWNEFGYLGNFALKYVKNKELKELVLYCRSKLKSNSNPLGLSDYYRGIGLGRKEWKPWNIVGAPSYSCLEQQFGRYCGN